MDDCGDPKLSERRTVRVKLSDINDNSPVFSYPSYTVHVREDESVQRVLPLRIHATGKQSYFDPLRPSSTLTRRRMFSPPPPFSLKEISEYLLLPPLNKIHHTLCLFKFTRIISTPPSNLHKISEH